MNLSIRALTVAALLGTFAFTSTTFALSPKDIALAQKVMREAAKLAEKYQKYDLEAPEPRADSEGKYVSPYTGDGEVT